jgi:hypothetical protein
MDVFRLIALLQWADVIYDCTVIFLLAGGFRRAETPGACRCQVVYGSGSTSLPGLAPALHSCRALGVRVREESRIEDGAPPEPALRSTAAEGRFVV